MHWEYDCIMQKQLTKKGKDVKMKEREKRQIQWEEAKQTGDNNAVLKSDN